jgi:hypothetical protein
VTEETWELPVIAVTWLLVTGPVEADAVRDWLGRLPLELGNRSLYDASDALTRGTSVAGQISAPGGLSLPVRFSVDDNGLAIEMDGAAGDDPWWSELVTEAGRTLRADTVALVDDPAELLPRLLWVSTTAQAGYEDARAVATTVECQWDGALLLYR